MKHQVFLDIFVLVLFIPVAYPQQTYTGNSILHCDADVGAVPSEDDFLYTCNGMKNVCLSFLIFKAQPPFDSVPAISALLSSDSDKLAGINNVTKLASFPIDREVIIPVNCKCSGRYYEAMATFVTSSKGDGDDFYSAVANTTFQGLASCNSLKRASLQDNGDGLRVPLKCACPTRNQSLSGMRYLLSYTVSWGDTINGIRNRFNATIESIFDANGFSDDNPTIYPFTTILVPLRDKPSSWHMQVPFHRPGLDHLPPPPPVSLKPKSTKKVLLGLAVSAGSCLGLALALFLASRFYMKRRERKTDHGVEYGQRRNKSFLPGDLRVEIASLEGVLRVFSFEELQKATRNFCPGNRIEGSIYRGVFGQETLAVKKKNVGDISAEVNILKKLNHFNLVKLIGYCGGEIGCFSVVFEYTSGGSLKEWIKNNRRSRKTKSWRQRIQIAVDVANGLHYLHNFTEPAYVHGNINSSNILLNSDIRAKIGNFSLARAVSKMAPHGETGPATAEDVYAFGMLMLELITIKNPGSYFAEDQIRSFIDPRLGKGAKDLAMKVAKLSHNCLVPEPKNRPGMEDIVSSLLKIQAGFIRTIPRKSREAMVTGGDI